ncbi:MAG: LamG domain-containing protein, partial [Verrucomicrobiae bacterium]|nr:LamG domain-containing protein [Verrucomicrobiae bacterium]
LKYRDPVSNDWRLKVYSVVAEQAPYFFRYDGVVGNEIQPPMPLAALPLMTQTNQWVSGPAWQDRDGRYYARAAASSAGEADIVLRYFYPLQAGFFYDLQRNGRPAAAEGDPIAWLDQRTGGKAGVPVDVHYTIQWPASAPVLQLAQTLTTATGGLPDITDMASATVVFDSLDPQGNRPLSAAARLYDPLTPRFASLEASFQFPDGVVRQADPSTGYEVFPDLPYYLRVRLFHDPQNRRLGFRGFVLTPAPGANPITLINVISARERDAILALDSSASSSFKEAVDRLYWITRNPNQLDVDGNGVPDESLLVGITRQITTNSAGVVVTNLVRETLQGAKALAFGQPLPSSTPANVPALHFAGPQEGMLTERYYTNLTGNFTMELWVKPNDNLARVVTPQATNGYSGQSGQPYAVHPEQGLVVSGLTNHVGVGLSVGTNGVGVFEHGDNRIYSPLVYAGDLSGWHHFAIVYQDSTPSLYLDGIFVTQGIRSPSVPFPSTSLVRLATNQVGYGNFAGSIAEFRIWNYARGPEAIRANFDVGLQGTETGLVGLWRFAEGSGSTVADASASGNAGTLVGSPARVPSAFQEDSAARYLVIAENDDPSLVGLPVGLHVISLTNSLARGALVIIQSDNVLDERVTLRHSADFGAQPENFVFQWFYQVDGASDDPNLPAFDPTAVPLVNDQGEITNPRNWISFPVNPQSGQGVNDITLGTGQQSSLLTLSDAWYLMRYGVQDSAGHVRWSGWIGDPAGTADAPRAMFVPGWVKRVLSGINLFGQRSSDFENYAPNTLADALASAGPRYEGDVALNPSALDNFGLIEIYSTVLNRARNLSIDGTPPVTYEPADKALLDAAGNLADLYQLHADEAFADAADPTIGLTTDSTTLGSLASSVFAF